MLFAAEGGGFFTSSATGYSKGLALLLLGQRNEERPMKVTPWNQYHLVEQEGVPDFQLASRKSRVPCGCASFICFGRASAGTDGSFPPKVGPVQQPETSNPCLTSHNNVISTNNDHVHDTERKTCLKSNLKRHPENDSVVSSIVRDSSEENFMSSGATDRRKVQWTDACGRELVQIREFECSDDDDASDDEYDENGGHGKCECVIQ